MELAIVLVLFVVFVTSAAICALKGKPWLALFGVLGIGASWLGVLGLLVGCIAVVGAIRLAKPGSTWARQQYGPGKLAEADQRFATPGWIFVDRRTQSGPEPPHNAEDSAPWEEESPAEWSALRVERTSTKNARANARYAITRAAYPIGKSHRKTL